MHMRMPFWDSEWCQIFANEDRPNRCVCSHLFKTSLKMIVIYSQNCFFLKLNKISKMQIKKNDEDSFETMGQTNSQK